MKKTITRIIAVLLLVSLMLTLVSCAKPKTDFEKAKKNLEEAGYSVSVNNDPSDAGVEAILTASKGILDILAGDGDMIVITKFETLKAAKLALEEAKLSIEQEIEAKKLDLKIAKYCNKKFDENNESEIEKLEGDIKDLKAAYDLLGRSGKYVWRASSKDAIKATK